MISTITTLLLPFFFFSAFLVNGTNVTYDQRALVIDGKRRVLISGSIHYPRSTSEMWPDLILKAKDGGLDVIDTYVFWNLHEPAQGQYDFTGSKDLVGFVKVVAQAGLYVNLRIGPYVCAEWNYGGFPVWLHFIPGIKLRTNNQIFKSEMQLFTAKIVRMMKQEKLFASQGGPIILSQIENEYGNVQSSYGSGAKPYINWAASMATSLDTGVPWVMCQQADAPDPIINACNGFYCDNFHPNSPIKPKMWTENWSGWFLSFGGQTPQRPVKDLAFATARFFQRGGILQNYYMYHGGTNFGRTSGGPFITTSYDYDAPIDEYGLIRQPKWGHLKDLHKSIKLCEEALTSSNVTYLSLGKNLEAHVYQTGSGVCSAFLANIDTASDAKVTFKGSLYKLPAWSVSILPDCKTVAYNTAQINSQVNNMGLEYTKMKAMVRIQDSVINLESSKDFGSDWSWLIEPVGISKDNSFTNDGLLEQISTTKDVSDYLWYSTSLGVHGDESFLMNGTETVLHIKSLGHVLHVFINGKFQGSGIGSYGNSRVAIKIPISLIIGKSTIDILSATVGLKNYEAFFDDAGAGITGPVTLEGKDVLNISPNKWTYQVGLKWKESDEFCEIAPESCSKSESSLPKNRPLMWYKTKFDAPNGNEPIAIDFTGMGKGEAWVNGQSIGRFWPTYIAPETGCSNCNFRGNFYSSKCFTNCGKPSQQLYHVPRSMVKSSPNTLVVFEEMGGDPSQISFAKRNVQSVCAHVSEFHPPPLETWNLKSSHQTASKSNPSLRLECPGLQHTISYIKFASFGTPLGSCGSFFHGECKSDNTLSIIQNACIGSRSCSIGVSTSVFGDPCIGVDKSLAVEVVCS